MKSPSGVFSGGKARKNARKGFEARERRADAMNIYYATRARSSSLMMITGSATLTRAIVRCGPALYVRGGPSFGTIVI